MKKIIIILCYLSIFSCKKTQEKISINAISKTFELNKAWQGDPLISDLNFVNSIGPTCKLNDSFFGRADNQVKDDNLKCALSRIKFNYEKLSSLKSKISIGNIGSSAKIFIKTTKPYNTQNADVYNQATLYIEINKNITDSIIIYRSINFSEALTVKERNYFISNDNIYLLDIAEDESGTNVEKWSHNKINSEGKIVRIKQKKFSLEDSEKTIQTENNQWKGTYHFEASNRDNVKTIFDITINSLNDILINLTEEGIKTKYSNVKAEKIDFNKIKIIYDPSSDDMGTIYVEKSYNEYYISGNPIYFINPGNNEMPLIKIK
ncbi:hypothetical protein SAMN05421856_103133 [Chryseobacterium taichungense]|uniref:Uncharacterized protein n=1 Tax=Chryseobacterium taichungense TaxID=295069 RepID=A0A1H7YAH9_9FLAO|nr:hypothetical protein [Chryseobacterium taichungense]SEM42199.1 hypothetical protein SAMN05421856_103133 [Chryseobacterium taichungense]